MEPPQSADSLLDYSQLESFVAIGYADYNDLLGDVERDVVIHLDAIQQAILAGNQKDLKARSHSLRGMLSYFGCIAMTGQLKSLEDDSSLTPQQAAIIHNGLGPLWVRSLGAIRAWEKTVADFV